MVSERRALWNLQILFPQLIWARHQKNASSEQKSRGLSRSSLQTRHYLSKSLFDAIWNFNCVDLTMLNLFLSIQILFEKMFGWISKILVSKCEDGPFLGYLGNSTWWSTQWLRLCTPTAGGAGSRSMVRELRFHQACSMATKSWFGNRPLRTWHSQHACSTTAWEFRTHVIFCTVSTTFWGWRCA